ncbi:MAG: hypothetical protein JSU86_02315, partial [Phycisphaerales bacterium]
SVAGSQHGGASARQELSPYALWLRRRTRRPAGSMYELLDSEHEAIIDYALNHAEIRHRELAWRMLDEGVVAVSASSVHSVPVVR